jgi:hypothetical protein
MPKIKTDYSKLVLYKIVSNDLEIKDCYIGHTTNFVKRKYSHKFNCNNPNCKEYNSNVYKFIRDNGGWDNWSMIEIKKYPCNDKREAEAEERRCIESEYATLNCNRPFIKEDERKLYKKTYGKKYRDDNPDKVKEYGKKYRDDNPDKVKEYHKIYYQDNADKFKEYGKKYRDDNPDKVKEYNKKYKEDNADKIKEYQKEYNKKYNKKYKEVNADKIKEYQKKYRLKKKEQKINNI